MEKTLSDQNSTYSLEDYNFNFNESVMSIPELQCLLSFYNQTVEEEQLTLCTPTVCLTHYAILCINSNAPSCNTTYDGLTCWPPTTTDSYAVIQCMEYLNNVPYDTTQNATRECFANGSWAPRSDYSRCRPLYPNDEALEVLWDVKDAHTIYSVGYGLSLIALSIALWIFLYFRDLRCQRNTIHTNLLVTYLFIDLTWIVTAALQASRTSTAAAHVACYLVILLTYLMVTNFFWMFVEGLYLYMLVVKTFSVEKVKLQAYIFIGWGIPALVIIPWAIVKSHYKHISGDIVLHGCPWQNKDHLDYIFMCPVIVVLLVNIYFLGRIMWVLITKLRAATTVESKQYRVRIETDSKTSVSNYQIKKAAKALLVLIPLLGVTYIVVIVTPTHRVARVIFSYAQATLLSTQGFTVAVLYCFMNGEVRKSVRHHLEQWKDQRGLGNGRRQLRLDDSKGGDGGIKMYTSNGRRDRTSCISLSTSGTWLSTNNYKTPTKPENGSYSPVPVRDDNI